MYTALKLPPGTHTLDCIISAYGEHFSSRLLQKSLQFISGRFFREEQLHTDEKKTISLLFSLRYILFYVTRCSRPLSLSQRNLIVGQLSREHNYHLLLQHLYLINVGLTIYSHLSNPE